MGSNVITKDNTNIMKGIGAILILLHHIVQYIPLVSKYYTVTFGYSFVGIFFLISGYGITKSNRGLFSRILKLYSYFLIALFLYLIIFNIFDIEITINNVLKSLIGLFEIVNFSWYIFEIIILNIMYFINEKLFKGNYLSFIIMVITMFMILFIKEVDEWLYMSLFMFPIGVLLGKKERLNINKINNIIVFILFIIINILLILFVNKTTIDFKILNMFLFLLHIVLFNYLFLVICKRINIKNKYVKDIFNLSSFIYLSQGIVIRLFIMYEYNNNVLIYIPGSIIFTLILAIVLKYLYNLTLKKLLTKC